MDKSYSSPQPSRNGGTFCQWFIGVHGYTTNCPKTWRLKKGGGMYDFMIPGAQNLGWVSWAYFCGLTEPTQEVKRPRGSFSRDHPQVDHPEQPCLRRYHTRAQNPKRDIDG